MSDTDFSTLLDAFQSGGVDEKINIYISTPGLSQSQYAQLLRAFPLDQLGKLEAALG